MDQTEEENTKRFISGTLYSVFNRFSYENCHEEKAVGTEKLRKDRFKTDSSAEGQIQSDLSTDGLI